MFHQFCRKADVAIVTMALEFNADVLKPNGDGMSPLDIAANGGKDKVVDLLVKSAKSFLNDTEMKEYLSSGLVSACKNPKGTMVTIKLLIALGCDMVHKSPLDVALRSNHVDAIKYFLESGVDLSATVSAATIGWLATTEGQFESLKNLIDKIFSEGSTVDKDRLRREWNVFEAAHRASEMDKKDVVKYLCEKFSIDESIVAAANGPGHVVLPMPMKQVVVEQTSAVKSSTLLASDDIEKGPMEDGGMIERKKSSLMVSRLSSKLSDTKKKASGIFAKLSKSLKRN